MGGHMNKRVVRRLLETFFRRWWLYLLPVALLVAGGIALSLRSGSGYQAVGVVDVSKGTLLSELTSIRGEQFGYDTPATSTARTLNSLLRTDNFIEAVAKRAGVTTALKTGELTSLQIRDSIAVSADGDNLLSVVSTTSNPELSARLARATIDSFIEYRLAGDVSESKAAEQFFNTQLSTYQQQLDAAQKALADYAAAHPGGPQDERPLAEQVEIDRLKSAVTEAQAPYASAQGKSDEARLATEQAASDVNERLRVIDEPSVPGAPVPRLKSMVITLALFTIVGSLVAFGAVVLASTLDRTMRSPEDVEDIFGLPVLTVVPESRTSRTERRASKDADQEAAAPARRAPTRAATVKAGVERPRAIKAGASSTGRSSAGRSDGSRKSTEDRSGRSDETPRALGGGPTP